MIDLHIHTKHSDGLMTPAEILRKAEELKLSTISITDHNTIDAYKEISAKNDFKGSIIIGCEPNCMLDDLCIDLLAYCFDPNKMQKVIKELYLPFHEQNIRETNLLIDSLLQTPLAIDKKAIVYDAKEEYGDRAVHREIIKHPENKRFISLDAWEDVHIFNDKYIDSPDSVFYVDFSSLLNDYKTVVEAIKDSEGLVFMPHIFKYADRIDLIIEKLFEGKLLDGIECFHSSFNSGNVKEAIELAKKYNLYMSGGTDTHGYEGENEVYLGTGYGDMNIPDDIIKKWSSGRKLIKKRR